MPKIDLIERGWALINAGQINEALTMSEQFVQTRMMQFDKKEKHEADEQRELLHACHLAGYAVSLSTENTDALVAISYFNEMAEVAHLLEDDVQKGIALSYQGDAYRRHGNLTESLSCLRTAYDLSQSDPAAMGNCAQLLGRLSSEMNDEDGFSQMMREAEQTALKVHSMYNSLQGHFSLGTVCLDYAVHYSKIGRIQEALNYSAQAKAVLPNTPFWSPYLDAMHGELLLKSGDLGGVTLMIEAVKLAKNQGNYRLLESFTESRLYISRKTLEYSEAAIQLSDALFGSSDF